MADFSDGSVTRWIRDVKAGERAAFEQLYRRYFDQLVALARRRMEGARARRVMDEEDVTASAMQSFWEGAEAGHFQKLKSRDDLWPLLVVITIRKAIDAIHRENRRRPPGGVVRGDSICENTQADSPLRLDHMLRQSPNEQSLVELNEEYQRLLEKLDDEGLRQVARLKLEGHSREEIAAKLRCSPSTIARALRSIRRKWAAELLSARL